MRALREAADQQLGRLDVVGKHTGAEGIGAVLSGLAFHMWGGI